MSDTSILQGGSAGLSILSGLFGMDAAGYEADNLEAQASLARAESDADAERYVLTASRFKAEQSVAFLKSGVTLEGSPLDVLDETARVSRENLSAIKAEGAAKEQALRGQAATTKNAGRAAFIQGINSAISTYAGTSKSKTDTGLGPISTKGKTASSASGSKTYSKSARLNLITGF